MRFLVCWLIAFAAVVVLGATGGSQLGFDRAVIGGFVSWRTLHPQPTGLLIVFTQLGGFYVLIGLGMGGALWLLMQRQFATAVAFAATVLAGRATIELIKYLVARPRPSFDAHPVQVFSQSFPSAHAGNSMITYTALALFLAPPTWRSPALIAAILLAIAVGATRPMLGVHWPTDVAAGWLVGGLVVSLGWSAHRRRQSAA